MSLILRSDKGSRLSISEMDNNLIYLQGLSGGMIKLKVDDITFEDFNSAGVHSRVTFVLTDAKPANRILCGIVFKLTQSFITDSLMYPIYGIRSIFNDDILNKSVSEFGNIFSIYEDTEDVSITFAFSSPIDEYGNNGSFGPVPPGDNPVDYTSGNIEVYLILKDI